MTTRNHAATAASTAVDSTDDPIVTFRSHVIPKLGAHAKGSITYAVGIGPDGAVCLSIVANQGGGYYSKEWVAFGRICEVLAHFRTSGNAFITQTLLAAFGNRSTNNARICSATGTLVNATSACCTPLPTSHTAMSSTAIGRTGRRNSRGWRLTPLPKHRAVMAMSRWQTMKAVPGRLRLPTGANALTTLTVKMTLWNIPNPSWG